MNLRSFAPLPLIVGLAGTSWPLARAAAPATTPAQMSAASAAAPAANSNAVGAPRGSFRSVLRPVLEVPLSSRAAGVVDTIYVPEGSTVKAGQPIIGLDADQEKAELAQAEAALRGAQAEVKRATAEFDRINQLHTENI